MQCIGIRPARIELRDVRERFDAIKARPSTAILPQRMPAGISSKSKHEVCLREVRRAFESPDRHRDVQEMLRSAQCGHYHIPKDSLRSLREADRAKELERVCE